MPRETLALLKLLVAYVDSAVPGLRLARIESSYLFVDKKSLKFLQNTTCIYNLNMGKILGTEEGVEALAEFIEKSGAIRETAQVATETEEPSSEGGKNKEDGEEDNGRIAEEASDMKTN
ncbi:hypothetical protein F5050DRAFT_1710936 [Lentinula boryana]|uniref:Uncharacterized protein n=1 Tax=Lentinula boryana TaxID=40481 RepID=A0ABQ8QH98_9AGAR|nr:hypothetical protein F5050DRAFT_1710936 [Lentinula boryana]